MVRTTLHKISPNNQRKKPGPKPKPIAERKIPEIKPIQRVERTYSREKKIQVLCFLYHYRVPYIDPYGLETTREVQHDEASTIFLIPRSTISSWWKNRESIIHTPIGKYNLRTAFVCRWPEMEEKLFQAFSERRETGKTVRRGWFRRTSKRIFRECYPHLDNSLFCFSAGWFSGFLTRSAITLRFTTNKAQKIPTDYVTLVISWIQFNRRNSQPRSYLETVLLHDVGRYFLRNICNLDETPLPFEYLDGRTYNLCGSKTIWAKATRNGWDKRQATLILCIFADGISRIPPFIIFHGKGSNRMNPERKLYDPRTIVEFNPTAYNNEQLFRKYIDQYLVPALEGRPSLFAFDSAEFHKTPTILDSLRQHDIVPSIIPPGCTSLLQPLDISVNRPFKDTLYDLTERAIELRGQEAEDKWTVGERRILTTKCVADAWEDLCTNKRQLVIDSFRNVGLSLPIDGSQDTSIRVKGFAPGELVVGDWRREKGGNIEAELPLGHSISENTLISSLHDDSQAVEYVDLE